MTRAEALNFALALIKRMTLRNDDYDKAQDAFEVLIGMYHEELLTQQIARMSRVEPEPEPEVDGEGVPYDKDLLRPSFLEVEVQQPDPVVIFNGEVRPDLGLIDLLKSVLAVEDAEGHVVH